MTLLTTELASLLGTVRRPGDFFVAGTAELLAPSLDIEGVGPVALPLLSEQAGRIVAVAGAAPYGRGEETVVDPAVRRCWQVGPDRVRLGGRHWARTLDRIVARAAEGLGISDPVTAEFHKLLVYGPGSFFVGHRDTEKARGMFATLVVVLPSVFEGGDLLVRHQGREARLTLRCDEPAEAAFAAFYADCVHEVLPVTEGHRLTLAYNLVRAGKSRPPKPPDYEEQQAGIAALLRGWRDRGTQPAGDVPEKLIYPLDHAYTPAELGFAALKGADAAAAGVLAAAARQARCDLLVRHRGREARLALRCDEPAEAAFAAFYADCVHEVLPVTEGHRLTLAYNLVRAGKGRLPKPPDYEEQQVGIAALLRGWRNRETHPDGEMPEKLIYPLDHAYTPAELGFAALKGADAAAAGVLAAAARQARCDLHLALLTVEESGAAEHADSYGSRRSRWSQEDAFEAGEVYDRSVTLSEWRRPDGGETVLGPIPVDEEAELSPPDACDDLAPDEEHFHEATGNEGASFERTYKRAALVLWPSGRLFAVLSQAGLPVTLPYLEDLARRWIEGGETQQATLWREAHDLAGHMLARWPMQGEYGRHKTPSDAARMLAALTRLDDTAAIVGFLTGVTAEGCYEKGDNDALIGALGRLPQKRCPALIERVVVGTAVASFEACANLLARAAVEWPDRRTSGLVPAVVRLVEALPGGPAQAAPRPSWQGSPKVDASVVVDLMTGLCAIDGALAQRAADHLLAWPNAYGLDAVLVPATQALLGRVGLSCAAAIGVLRTACLDHLRARIAEPLAPPTDWIRPAAFACRCFRCAELARFLADPGRKAWAFKAAEADRRHVEDTVKRAGCDVDTATDRRGRPYSLVCTKNQASYERRAKQRRQDTENLARLAD